MEKREFKVGDREMIQQCQVKIQLDQKLEDYMDVNLHIEFLDGYLKGAKYHIAIDIEDFHEVWS